jgi:hypothetical protein
MAEASVYDITHPGWRDEEIVRLRAEIERWKDWAKRATKALCEVRPLGGSELFMHVNDENVADPEWCGRAIIEMRDSLHKARVDLVRAQKPG